jgi:hypothetical protein
MATNLHRRTLAFDYGNDERATTMRKVWDPTPWMIDVYTGSEDGLREFQIMRWCYDELGEQSSPIHGQTGRWHRGNATIYGWTWFGFATEADMQLFQATWPTPPGIAHPDAAVSS